MYRYLVILSVLLLCAAVLAAGPSNDEQSAQPSKERLVQSQQALNDFSISRPQLKSYKTGNAVTRLYGESFGGGVTAQDAAETFVAQGAAVFGVEARDLVPGSPTSRSMTSQPVMYDEETGTYKFDLVYYRQVVDGIPVFQSELRVLTRTEANHPVVLAVSTLKDLDGFQVDVSKAGYSAMAEQVARGDETSLTDFTEQETVIYAGGADKWDTPRMAATFTGTSDFPEEFLYVIDIETGAILYKEDRIVFEDVNGSVGGNRTPGPKSMECTPSTYAAFPYAQVQIIGGGTAYTNDRGDYTITNAGTGSVQVVSRLSGTYFDVTNYLGAEVADTMTVTPPGPAQFYHNFLDNQEHIRAQTNGYHNANEVRDWVLRYNPTYPTIYNQTGFPVSVNRTDGYCPGNAWYSPSEQSINFCESSSSYGNTSFASVSQHEYGHHIINMAGSGQGEYGEGMSDVVAALIADDPGLGYGFYLNDCLNPLRNADNTLQYPCSGSIHYCGGVISGSVWDTRTELAAAGGTGYKAIIANLAVNAILLHTGTEITPQITIDYLTLDDDDGNLANGTPHYYEIATGFGNHNLDAPPLALIAFSYPNGQPTLLNPNQATTFEVLVEAQESSPLSGTGTMYLAIDGGGFSSSAMTEISTNLYEATIPGLDCFQSVEFYFSCDEIGGATVYDPEPGSYYAAFVATEEASAFFDDFESELGWSGTGNWERGAATAGGGEYGNPDPGSAVSGTNVLGYDLGGDYEDGMSETHVTGPAIDCSQLVGSTLRFQRWLGVETSSYDHAYIRVSNNGSSWTTIWENGGEIEDGSWTQHEYDISGVADGQPTVYIRFTMGSTDGSWAYCGWNIDDLEVFGYSCAETSLQIVTDDLPDWTVGEPYSQQLQVSNATGTVLWADRDNDLVGTGLALSTGGLLDGTPTGAGHLAFVAQVTDDSKGVVEKALSVDVNPVVDITTTTLPEWTEGVAYSQQLTVTGGTGVKVWVDLTADLGGTGLTLSATGLVSGTPAGAGYIDFTARATDEIGADDQQLLGISVNAAVDITTTSLPDGAGGAAYSEQLVSSGGTGVVSWSDKNGDLAGTGLSMTTGGLISGTPGTVQVISLTAQASDAVGSSAEMPLTIDVRPSYICGDVDNDGDGPDVEDLIFLVQFMFQEGPTPTHMGSTDANGDGIGPNIEDLIYLVQFMFQDGPDLICE